MTRKEYNTQPKNNNVYSADTFDDLLLGKIYNIYGEKVEPYKGMWVVVKSDKFKIYLLKENDISKSQNWMLIGKCLNKKQNT
jgi:hypothetical protein